MSLRRRLRQALRKRAKERESLLSRAKPKKKLDAYHDDPVGFAIDWLDFHPTRYQADLLTERSKRIVVVYPRQSGKTTTLAVRLIWFAATHPRTTSLIVAPGLRQSMIVMDRIQTLLMEMPRQMRREIVRRMQRTVIWFKRGSQILALPSSTNLLRGYSCHLCVADESAFFRDDELMFYSVLFPMLQTTDGTLIASSTPWGKDSVFYKFTQDQTFTKKWIKIDDVIDAGLTTKKFVEEMKQRTPTERFRREYLAEFVEDELAYITQKLITANIDSELTPITEDWTRKVEAPAGRYFLGVDFGKEVDYSAIAIVRWNTTEERAELVGMVRFPLKTPYATVLGMIKIICDKLHNAERVYVDHTGVGVYITEDLQALHIRSKIEPVNFTLTSKQNILGHLKNLMEQEAVALYYDPDLIAEINVERFQLTKNGQIQFSHPQGTHDDRLWALALAVYATRTPDTSILGIGYGVTRNY